MIKEFNLNDILNSENKIIIYKIQLNDINRILNIVDDVDNEFIFKEFKYSSDNSTYSYWKELTIERLNSLQITNKFYLKLRYTLENYSQVINITKLKIEYEETANSYIKTTKYNQPSAIEIQSPKFDVYQNTSVGNDLQQKISRSINEFIGVDCIYYKSNVIETDTFLHEYNLLELADEYGTEMKVVFDSNEMPEKPMITPFGTTFEVPVEIHIDHTYFQSKFKDYIPSAGDIIFIPITKAIWEVNGSTLQKGYMNKAVFWKVTLIKYQKRASRLEDNLKHDSILDNLKESGYEVMSAEDAFRDNWNEEAEKIIKPRETRIDDDSKDMLIINPKVIPIKEDFENNFIVVSHFNYDISNINNTENALTYNKSFSTKNDISFSAWIKFNESKQTDILVKIENNIIYSSKFNKEGNFILKNKISNELINVNIINKTINININNGLYYVIKNNYVNIYNDWFILNNKYIINNIYKIIEEIPVLTNNNWYNIILTESVRYNQIGIYFYNLAPNLDDIDLYYKKIINKSINSISFDKITINGGLKRITNIRLFDEMLQESDHNLVLNQQLVNDSQKAIILDNVKPKFIQKYYSRPL